MQSSSQITQIIKMKAKSYLVGADKKHTRPIIAQVCIILSIFFFFDNIYLIFNFHFEGVVYGSEYRSIF
jgi:hypothetical protein